MKDSPLHRVAVVGLGGALVPRAASPTPRSLMIEVPTKHMSTITISPLPLTMSIREAAAALSVSDDHLLNLIHKQRILPASRLGRRLVVRREDVEALLLRSRI